MKQIISVTLSFIILFCTFSFGPLAADAQAASKFTDDLNTALENLHRSETTLAFVEMVDVDHSAVMQEFAKLYPEDYKIYMDARIGTTLDAISDHDAELLQRAIERKREVYSSIYKKENEEIIHQVFSEDALVYLSNYAPVAIVETSRSSAYQLARSSSIVSISAFQDAPLSNDNEDEWPEGPAFSKVMLHLERANSISKADVLRDTYDLRGSGVKIGILESKGVPDVTNPYLANASIVLKPDQNVPPSDHATLVAAIIAGSTEDDIDYGIVPDATLYCARSTHAQYMYHEIEWMISCGVNIINASVGYIHSDGSYDEYAQWVDHIAVWHDVHFVNSAGNYREPEYILSDNYISHTVTSPGTAYNAITVGCYIAYDFFTSIDSFVMATDSNYVETGTPRPEKPNLSADGFMGYYNEDGIRKSFHGTSFTAPQVTGVIAQLCCWDASLKFKQSVVGAILAASSAEKIEAVGDGTKGDVFVNPIAGSAQISDKEGAGILNALWAWGIVANGNHWSVKPSSFPYEKTITINTSANTISRVAIFWLKRNSNSSCTNGTTGSNPALANLDLYVYDTDGNLVASSTTLFSNFEIVQFIPEGTGEYIIRITGSTDLMEHVGIALW